MRAVSYGKDMENIKQIFKNKKAVNFYITAGYPDINTFKKILLTLSDAGVDLIEIGIPFSDPIADGKIIQKASIQVLKNNINIERIAEMLKSVKGKIKSKLLFMSYYNPIFVYGEKNFIALAKKCGISGIIVPDLPIEEGKDFYTLCNKHGLETIILIASVTPLERTKKIARYITGFLYFISVLGTTGVRNKIPTDIINQLKEIRSVIPLPLCLGFGIKSKESIQPFKKYIDGAIIGSALIKLIDKYNKNKSLLYKKITAFAKEIQEGLL